MTPMFAVTFDPEAYYDEDSLRARGLDGDALRKARDAGDLRFRKVGRRVIYKGAWLRDWLDAEPKPR